MVETPSVQVQRPEWTNHTSQNATADAVAPVTCVICEASYAPSHVYKRFLQGSPVVLESAYMSMCHYCFRCRRPACPECWDAVHGICGACVQEANLPFRTQVQPLEGVLFPPVSAASSTTQAEMVQENTASSLFICVKHGKFYPSISPANDVSTVQTIETATIESTDKYSELQSGGAQEPSTTSEAQTDPGIVGAGLAPALVASAQEVAPVKQRRSGVKKIELVLTVIVTLALLAIAVMIGLAEYSASVNTFINHLLHIDIRAEVAYLLHLIQQYL